MNKEHPVKWVVKNKDQTEFHQYKKGDKWTDKNKLFSFRDIDLKEALLLCVYDNKEKELCHINIGKQQLIVKKTVFKSIVYANAIKLINSRVTPEYYYHYENYIGQKEHMTGYVLSLKHEYVNNYGIRFAISRLICHISTTGELGLDGMAEMKLEFKSFADAEYDFIVEESILGKDGCFLDRKIFSGPLEVGRSVEFEFIDLNL